MILSSLILLISLEAGMVGPPESKQATEAPFPFDTSEGTHIVFLPAKKPHDHTLDDTYKASIRDATIVIGLSDIFDYGSTKFALRNCSSCRELHPLGKFGRAGQFMIQGINIGIVGGLHRYLRKHEHHKAAKNLLIVEASAKFIVGLSNIYHGLK